MFYTHKVYVAFAIFFTYHCCVLRNVLGVFHVERKKDKID